MTVRNHNRSTALERSVLNYWGLKPVLWDPNLALSLDKIKYNAEGNADSLRVAKKSCNKQTIINVITNKYEPQQKHRLGTVSKHYAGGDLNRFYGIPTSPSASVMAQNIQLFGPREGFLTHQWIITGNK